MPPPWKRSKDDPEDVECRRPAAAFHYVAEVLGDRSPFWFVPPPPSGLQLRVIAAEDGVPTFWDFAFNTGIEVARRLQMRGLNVTAVTY